MGESLRGGCRSGSSQQGRVTVAGEVVTDPARDVGEGDDVRVDGSPVGVEAREVWAVNKPAGVVSTAKEPGARPAVVSLVDSARAALPGRPPRRRLDRPAAAHQRRRAGQPAHPPALRSRQGLPGGAAPAAAGGGPAPPRRGRRSRGRPDRAGRGPAARRARDRGRPARGPQPPGAAHGRGDRQPGRRPCAASASARSSSATSPRARRAGSPRRRSPRLRAGATPGGSAERPGRPRSARAGGRRSRSARSAARCRSRAPRRRSAPPPRARPRSRAGGRASWCRG